VSKRPSNRVFFVSFLLVSLVVAGVVSFYASGHPDGLNYVAEKTGFIDAEKPHASSDSPFAGYSTKGVDDARLSGGIAGVVGVLLMLGLSTALFWGLRRRGGSTSEDDSEDDSELVDSRD
jgi:cobalt/nickel transport system permease protein/cobalt/nickel transport protein